MFLSLPGYGRSFSLAPYPHVHIRLRWITLNCQSGDQTLKAERRLSAAMAGCRHHTSPYPTQTLTLSVTTHLNGLLKLFLPPRPPKLQANLLLFHFKQAIPIFPSWLWEYAESQETVMEKLLSGAKPLGCDRFAFAG